MLTTPQVAHLIGKSTRTVQRAIADGELKPAMQAGTGTNAPYLFERAEVDRWIAKYRHGETERVSA
jgi:excisionase family DNA binding protein